MMNALVLKTNEIVNIVEKRGEHYIDSNFNPYTKEEIEFFIKQNYDKSTKYKNEIDADDEEQEQMLGFEFNGKFISFEEFNRMQNASNYVEKIMWLATSVIEHHPDFSPQQVAMFSYHIYKIIKDKIRNEK